MILFFAESAAIILLSQILHSVTYGTFHMASILYIDRLAPANAKTLGQAVNNGLTYGFGLMLGFFINGYLYEATGSFVPFLISSLIALSGGLFFQSYQLASRKQNIENVYFRNPHLSCSITSASILTARSMVSSSVMV